MRVTIYNRSTVVNADQFSKMVTACNQYFTSFSQDWKIEPIQVVSATYSQRDPILDNTVYILDNTDSPGALGYHYESNGVAISKVFAKTTTGYGGAILFKDANTFTVSSVVSHEILEMVGNGNINKWYLDNNGTFWAGEMCDAVESNLYIITLTGNIKVGMSDYILPAWTKPDLRTGPFNKMNTLKSPMTVDKYGYSIIVRRNTISAIYGSNITSEVKQKSFKDIKEISEATALIQETDESNPIKKASPKNWVSDMSDKIREQFGAKK